VSEPEPSKADPAQPWRITMTAERFATLRGEERFRRMLTLARIANSIRYAVEGFRTDPGTRPRALMRQASSGFLYSSALLFEALEFADTLGQHFRQYDAFKSVTELRRDPRVIELRAGALRRLRNLAVYHHNDESIRVGLELLEPREYTFASGDSHRSLDVYFNLADLVLLHFAVEPDEHGAASSDAIQSRMREVMQVARRFLNVADELVGEILNDLGLEQEPEPPEGAAAPSEPR
jgi:hypothetical protein